METETNVDGVTSLHVYYEYYPSKNKRLYSITWSHIITSGRQTACIWLHVDTQEVVPMQ